MAGIIEEGRYGFTFLAKANKATSLESEVMIDHKTGELLVRDYSGNLITFDKLSRLKTHVEDFSKTCKDKDFHGNISIIEPKAGVELPYSVAEATNILESTIPISVATSDGDLFISIDWDMVYYNNLVVDPDTNNTKSNTVELTPNQPTVTLELKIDYAEVGVASAIVTKTIEFKKSELNYHVINIKHLLETNVIHVTSVNSITLNSIKFNRDIRDSSKKLLPIVYSILYTLR